MKIGLHSFITFCRDVLSSLCVYERVQRKTMFSDCLTLCCLQDVCCINAWIWPLEDDILHIVAEEDIVLILGQLTQMRKIFHSHLLLLVSSHAESLKSNFNLIWVKWPFKFDRRSTCQSSNILLEPIWWSQKMSRSSNNDILFFKSWSQVYFLLI